MTQSLTSSRVLARSLLASVSLALALALGTMPLGVWFGVVPVPSLALAVVFFWAVYDSDALPLSLLFVLGVINDFLSGSPLGLWGLLFILLHIYMVQQERIFATMRFLMQWVSFGLVSFLAYAFIYLLFVGWQGLALPFSVIFVSYGFTFLFFPLVFFFLNRLVRVVR